MKNSLARFLSFVLNPLVVLVFLPYFLVYKSIGDTHAAIAWTGYTFIFLFGIGEYSLSDTPKNKYPYAK